MSEEILTNVIDAYRKIRNTLRFILGNISGFTEKDRVSSEELLDIDKWMLSKLQRLISDLKAGYDNYEFHKVFRLAYNFCVVELSSFYFNMLKDRLYTFNKKSKERLSAQTVIDEIFCKLLPFLTPIISFTAEETYQEYKKQDTGSKMQDSVFLLDIPEVNEKFVNQEIEKKFEEIIKIRDVVLKSLEDERKKGVIGNSLEAKIVLYTNVDEKKKFLKGNHQNLLDTFLVSQLEIAESSVGGNKDESENLEVKVLPASGKKCVRCWMWSDTVGKEPAHQEICLKCVKNL